MHAMQTTDNDINLVAERQKVLDELAAADAEFDAGQRTRSEARNSVDARINELEVALASARGERVALDEQESAATAECERRRRDLRNQLQGSIDRELSSLYRILTRLGALSAGATGPTPNLPSPLHVRMFFVQAREISLAAGELNMGPAVQLQKLREQIRESSTEVIALISE